MKIDYSILDLLIEDNISFAAYRLPAEKHIHLIVQQSNALSCFNSLTEVSGKRGFLITPFQTSLDFPVVLIPEDIHLIGDKAIHEFALSYQDKRLPNHPNFPVLPPFSTSREQYQQMFDVFQNALDAGKFEKLVLSRRYLLEKPKGFSPSKAYKKAVDLYPNAFVYLAYTPFTGIWMGSTPELLLAEENGVFHTTALAGTQMADNVQDVSCLTWNEKNRREQAIVSEYMRNLLQKQGLEFSESEVYSFRAGNVAHLKTDFHFQSNPSVSTGALLAAIHPSPAVCGIPKSEASSFIQTHESHDRAYYSGFTGNLSMNNRTDLYVNLRCMQILPHSLVLYAGGGILISSQAEEEWKETEDKMQAMLKVLQ